MVVRITDQIGEKPTDRLPYKGIIQKEVIHFRKELNQGYYVKNYERIYFILPLGLNNAFAYVQKVEKRMLKHAKNGEIKQLDNFFGELVDVSKNIVKGQTRIIAS